MAFAEADIKDWRRQHCNINLPRPLAIYAAGQHAYAGLPRKSHDLVLKGVDFTIF
jgi:hypothetical protein